jgi:DNA-binding transcriptional MerR regulator
MTNPNIKKLYHSIGEVSTITGLKQYVLRYWESEFPQLTPAKNRSGNRTYREKDIELIQFIKILLYERKYTIDGARQKLKEIHSAGLAYDISSLALNKDSNGSKPSNDTQTNDSLKDQYVAFLTRLKNELESLVQIIE